MPFSLTDLDFTYKGISFTRIALQSLLVLGLNKYYIGVASWGDAFIRAAEYAIIYILYDYFFYSLKQYVPNFIAVTMDNLGDEVIVALIYTLYQYLRAVGFSITSFYRNFSIDKFFMSLITVSACGWVGNLAYITFFNPKFIRKTYTISEDSNKPAILSAPPNAVSEAVRAYNELESPSNIDLSD